MSKKLIESDDLRHQNYQEHACAIGTICIQWALLDRTLDLLIEKIIGLDEPVTACLLSTSRDTSQKCEIAFRLSVQMVPDCAWRECLFETIKIIQNKFCQKRNRFVHDELEFSETAINQFSRRVSTTKLQAGESLKLIFETSTEVKTADLDLFIADVTLVIFGLAIMGSQLSNSHISITSLVPPNPLMLLIDRYKQV